MTVKEFYEYAKENELLDYRIEIQYRDDGGDYYGTDTTLYLVRYDDDKVILL